MDKGCRATLSLWTYSASGYTHMARSIWADSAPYRTWNTLRLPMRRIVGVKRTERYIVLSTDRRDWQYQVSYNILIP